MKIVSYVAIRVVADVCFQYMVNSLS